RILRSVVQSLVLAMLNTGHDVPLRRAVAGELISDHDAWRSHLLLQQLRSSRLAACLSRRRWTRSSSTMPVWSPARHNQFLHPGDLEHDLIQMPLVASPRKATTDLIGELPAEFARPLPHGFVADDDAAGSEQLLHHAETKRKAEIKPYGMADDLGRKPIAGIAEASKRHHPTRLPILVCQRKPGPQVDGAIVTLVL